MIISEVNNILPKVTPAAFIKQNDQYIEAFTFTTSQMHNSIRQLRIAQLCCSYYFKKNNKKTNAIVPQRTHNLSVFAVGVNVKRYHRQASATLLFNNYLTDYDNLSTFMDEQPPKCSSGISVESDSSEPLSIRSLGPVVPKSGSKSSESMVEVMSLERSQHSGGLMNRILGPIESNSRELQYLMRQGVRSDESRDNYLEEEEKIKIEHVCVCTTTCQHERCPCLSYENEQCSPYFCCPKCIEAKSQPKEPPIRGRGSVQIKTSTTSCMCFKTNCLKKYCTCFAAGQKCGRKCKCEDCENWEIELPECGEPYLENESNQRQMPEAMEFQPVDLNISD